MCNLIPQRRRASGQEVVSFVLVFAVLQCYLCNINIIFLCNFCKTIEPFSSPGLSHFLFIAGYEEIKTQTTQNQKVFFEKKKVCCLGTAQYLLDSARVEKRSVTNDFATAVCNLPEAYDQRTYRTFVENWGTVSAVCFQLIILFKTIFFHSLRMHIFCS